MPFQQMLFIRLGSFSEGKFVRERIQEVENVVFLVKKASIKSGNPKLLNANR